MSLVGNYFIVPCAALPGCWFVSSPGIYVLVPCVPPTLVDRVGVRVGSTVGPRDPHGLAGAHLDQVGVKPAYPDHDYPSIHPHTHTHTRTLCYPQPVDVGHWQ